MKASKRSQKDARGLKLKEDEDMSLDAGVWGKLQDFIPLYNIYEKLSNQELYRLRFVSKAWNDAALQTLEPKPYFVIIGPGSNEVGEGVYLNGILSYDAASGKCTFKRQRFPLLYSDTGISPFAVEGLIFCHHPENLEQRGVFNIHNKTWHAIPPAPEKSEHEFATGMMVDTSKRPYSFKVVVGSFDRKTQIYDSELRSWSTTSSRLPQSAMEAVHEYEIFTCMCSNGCVYISIGADILLMYSMEGDTWIIVEFPEVKQHEVGGGVVHALGLWEGRIFTTREDCKKRNGTVWELTNQEWVQSVIISGKDYSGLMKCDFASWGHDIYFELRVVPCFCDGYLLMYNWHYSGCQSYALGVLNLATSEWEKVYVPPGAVAREKAEESSDVEEGRSEGGSDSDEDAEEDDQSGNEASGPGCAAKAIRIRRDTGCAEVHFQHQTDRLKTQWEIDQQRILLSKIAHRRQVHRERDLEMQEALRADSVGVPVIYVTKRAIPPPSTPGKIVSKPTRDEFECAMCGFGSDAPDEYLAHNKSKVHRALEELRKDQKYHYQTPLSLMHQYVASNRFQVSYETKAGTCARSFEVVAVVQGAADGSAGPITGFGASHHKKKKAKHMAAADALERIMENVAESEFTSLARRGFVVGGRNRKRGRGGNTGGSGSSGGSVGV